MAACAYEAVRRFNETNAFGNMVSAIINAALHGKCQAFFAGKILKFRIWDGFM